ncbi:MAG: M4 family metallopeptidase [Gammaproteobacteria bacterium]
MCISTTHRHSIFCILPPHLLRSIAQNGAPQQRATALNTLSTDNTFRALRATAPQALAARRQARMVVEGQKQRTIYDTQQTQTLPGRVVRTEGSRASKDVAVNEAYNGLGATFDFFWEVYARNSIDDEGMPLNATVHFNQDYDNAFWDGQQMVFGDGDGELFNRFTIAVDVIGHELGHGVTEDEGPLVYFTQAGALNESMSDVFGSLVKHYILKQTVDQADWLIGAGLLTQQVQGVALRSLKAPGSAYDDPMLGKDPQPGHMNDFVQTYQDNGGVHINSGIPNHAFYFIAMGLGGHAWEKAGRIWYETLRDPQLRPNAGFRRFARLAVTNAVRLYGAGSEEQKAVVDGWDRVGIKLV